MIDSVCRVTIGCLAFAILFPIGVAVAQGGNMGASDCLMSLEDLPPTSPRFEDFPATTPALSKPAPAKPKGNPDAERFRTVLRSGAAEGPNFAGHYTIVAWGCGAACVMWAIVDARTGSVFFDPETSIVGVFHVDVAKIDARGGDRATSPALHFRRDSDLLIVLGAPQEDAKREGIAYYRWNGRSLDPLGSISFAKLCQPAASAEPASPIGSDLPRWTLTLHPGDIVIGPALRQLHTRHHWSAGFGEGAGTFEVAVRRASVLIPAPGCRMDYLILAMPVYYPENPQQAPLSERRAVYDALLAMQDTGSGEVTARVEGQFWRAGPKGPELTTCNLYFTLPLSEKSEARPSQH